jgi:uncharacterized protein YuzE
MASVEFDPEVNAMYLRLKKGKVAKSEPIADNIVIDLDENNQVVGIEILFPKLDARTSEVLSNIMKKARIEV